MLNLNNINLKDLKAIAKEIGIKGASTMRKPELMDNIVFWLEQDENDAAIVEQLASQIEPSTPRGTVKPSAGIKELTFNGKTQSLNAWADEIGLKRPALYDRINRQHWSVKEALTIPAGGHRPKRQVEGQIAIEE